MAEKKLGNLNGFDGGNYAGNVYDHNAECPTLNTMSGGDTQPMIVDGLNSEEDGTCRTLKGRYAKTSAANFDRGNTFGASGVVETSVQLGFMDNGTGQHQSNTVYAENALCPNITTIQGGGTQQIKVESRYRIRKLTPIECWRLMDFSDEDFHKAEQVNSNSQLYKEAGNSIVCNVLVAIFGQLIVGKEDEYKKINESEVQT